MGLRRERRARLLLLLACAVRGCSSVLDTDIADAITKHEPLKSGARVLDAVADGVFTTPPTPSCS